MRLPRLERFAFEIADGLSDFCDDRAIRTSMKAYRLDVRTDHGPLARPVLAHGLAAMHVATVHTVGPNDIIGERGQNAVYVPRIEAIVDVFEKFNIIVHWIDPHSLACCLPRRARAVRPPQQKREVSRVGMQG